jgi:hypothetical protein
MFCSEQPRHLRGQTPQSRPALNAFHKAVETAACNSPVVDPNTTNSTTNTKSLESSDCKEAANPENTGNSTAA